MRPMLAALVEVALVVVLATLLAVFLHEAGHVVAARLAGFKVLAFGLGVRKPWLKLGRRLRFFVGFPLTAGLTIALFDQLRPSRGRLVGLLLGGATANLATAVVVAVLWLLGMDSMFLKVLLAVSILMVLVSGYPSEKRIGRATLVSDGGLAKRYWQGTWTHESPGLRMQRLGFIRDLTRQLGVTDGLAPMELSIAALMLELGDAQGAEAQLGELSPSSPEERAAWQGLERLVSVACRAESARPTMPALDKAGVDPAREPIIAAMWLLQSSASALDARHPGAAALARQASEIAAAGGYQDLRTSARALQLEAEAPEDLRTAVEEILRLEGASAATPMVELRLLSWTAKELAERGQTEAAGSYFHRAVARMREIGSSIEPVGIRDRFFRRWSRPLREAIGSTEDPLFLDTTAPVPSRPSLWLGLARSSALLAAASLFGAIALHQTAHIYSPLGLSLLFSVVALISGVTTVFFRAHRQQVLPWLVLALTVLAAIAFALLPSAGEG